MSSYIVSLQIQEMAVTSKWLLVLLCCGLLVLTMVVIVMKSKDNSISIRSILSLINQTQNSPIRYVKQESQEDATQTAETIIQLQRQRDELSKSMSRLSQEYHQYQCTMGTPQQISSSGGWCVGGSHHVTDAKLVPALEKLFEGSTVASFGDGDGGYKKLFDKSGKIHYDSYDGAPFCENKTNGLVNFLDLSIPVLYFHGLS